MFPKLDQTFFRYCAAYVAFSQRYAGSILLIAIVAAGIGGSLARKITVDARIEALLPEDTPSRLAVNELRRRLGSAEPLYLLVHSSDTNYNRRTAAALAEKVSKWPETRWAGSRRDPSFFLDRRLLYLPEADLSDLADQVERLLEWEQCKALPSCVNIDDRPDVDFSHEVRSRLEAQPSVGVLAALLGEKKGGEKTDNEEIWGEAKQVGELCNQSGTVCAVQAFLRGSPANLNYATRIIAKAEKLFAEIRSSSNPSDLKLATSGQYRNAPITKRMVVEDLRATTTLSLALIVGVLLLQFCTIRAFVILLLPLVGGALWAAGLIGVLAPELNLVSAFTLAVMAGLGIDFGLHLLTHYATQRQNDVPMAEAVTETLRTIGPAMSIAALTTGCGFAALAAASFRGFSEMGVLATLGVALAFLAYLMLFPSLIFFSHRLRPEAGSLLRRWRFRTVPWLVRSRLARSVALVGVGLAVAGALVGRDLAFEYNFRRLQPQVVSHGIPWKQAIHTTTRTPIFLMADAPEELRRVAQELRQSDEVERVQSKPSWVITPETFIPLAQAERIAAIARLRDVVEKVKKYATKKQLADIERREKLFRIDEPISAANLPGWVTTWFSDRDGVFGRLGVIYSDSPGSDARKMEVVATEIDRWRQRFPRVEFASAVALLGEVVPALRNDAPRIIGLALFGLLLATIAIGRSLSRTFLVLMPLFAAVFATIGLMVVFDLKVNFYNMLIFPLAFGIGVDGAIYVVWALKRGNTGRLHIDEFATTARAVLGSTVTTLVAFGSMAIATNPGLKSLSYVTMLALSMTLLANLIFLPALLRVMSRDTLPPQNDLI